MSNLDWILPFYRMLSLRNSDHLIGPLNRRSSRHVQEHWPACFSTRRLSMIIRTHEWTHQNILRVVEVFLQTHQWIGFLGVLNRCIYNSAAVFVSSGVLTWYFFSVSPNEVSLADLHETSISRCLIKDFTHCSAMFVQLEGGYIFVKSSIILRKDRCQTLKSRGQSTYLAEQCMSHSLRIFFIRYERRRQTICTNVNMNHSWKRQRWLIVFSREQIYLPLTFSSASTDCRVPKAVRSVTVRAEKTRSCWTLEGDIQSCDVRCWRTYPRRSKNPKLSRLNSSWSILTFLSPSFCRTNKAKIFIVRVCRSCLVQTKWKRIGKNLEQDVWQLHLPMIKIRVNYKWNMSQSLLKSK